MLMYKRIGETETRKGDLNKVCRYGCVSQYVITFGWLQCRLLMGLVISSGKRDVTSAIPGVIPVVQLLNQASLD